jgi:hypothetical protein
MLSEEQIIHKLESRGGPNLRVVDAPETDPWGGAEPKAAPAAAPDAKAPPPAEPPAPPAATPAAETAEEESPKGETVELTATGEVEEFAWESDAPQSEEAPSSGPISEPASEPHSAGADASSPAAPDPNRLGDQEDLGLPWSEPSAALVARAAAPRSPRLDLDRAEPLPAPVPQQSLFVRGFMFATAAFAVLFLAYVLAEPIARVPILGPVVGAYGDAVDGLRERLAVAFPKGA